MIPVKWKRKLRYKGHYMYNYVRPDKVMCALKWLKANNPLYSDIDINNDWINNELINNSEFVNPNDDNYDNTNEINETSDNNMQNPVDPMKILTRRAKARGFTIHDVPGNGISCCVISVT